MSTFGDNLRKIRKEKDMTQDEFAVLLGTSKQVISRYENGQRSPKISVVADYAEKLGVSISDLTVAHEDGKFIFFYPDEDGQPAPSDENEPDTIVGLDKDENRLVSIYRELNQNGKSALMKQADYLFSDPDMKKNGASNDATA